MRTHDIDRTDRAANTAAGLHAPSETSMRRRRSVFGESSFGRRGRQSKEAPTAAASSSVATATEDGRSALTDFCARVALLAHGNLHLPNGEDMLIATNAINPVQM